MSFTSVNFGFVVTTPRTQGRGDRSLIARSGIAKLFITVGGGVLRSNRGRTPHLHPPLLVITTVLTRFSSTL